MFYRKYSTSEKKKRLMKRKMGSEDYENDHFRNSLEDIDFKEMSFKLDPLKVSENSEDLIFKDELVSFNRNLELLIDKKIEYYNFDFESIKKSIFDVLNIINDIIFTFFEIDNEKKLFVIKGDISGNFTLILDFYEILLYIIDYLDLDIKVLSQIFQIMDNNTLTIFKNTINKSLSK